MKKYKKKPVVVEALQYTGDNLSKIAGFVGDRLVVAKFKSWSDDKGADVYYDIRTLEGDMSVTKGDYIIKGVQGEFYPCKPDIFEMTYDVVNEDKKTAKEMFEELGYEEILNTAVVIKYQNKKNTSLYIDIFLLTKTVFKYRLEQSISGVEYMAYHTTTQELQAINKKLEDLGW